MDRHLVPALLLCGLLVLLVGALAFYVIVEALR